MKHVLFMAAATVLMAAGSVIASDRHRSSHHSGHHSSHHGSSHFGLHSSGHHGGLHYGLHNSHHGGRHSGFGFAAGLLLGRSSGYYSSPSYRYSYSSPRYYSTPRYQSRSYSNPSCAIQIAPPAPRQELQLPAPSPLKKYVEPAPQPVLPLEPSPNVDSFDISTTARVSVARTRTVQDGIRIQPAQTGKATLGILGPQFATPQFRSLVADNAVPFIVPLQQDRLAVPVAVQDADDPLLLPPMPIPYVVDEPVSTTSFPPIPKAMQGIALLPVADRKVALAQRTCPVTGDLLGADGKPIKVQLRGRTVFVCCEGCRDDLKANPQKYLADRP